MQVLDSIDWTAIILDVLCGETDPTFRPTGYAGDCSAGTANALHLQQPTATLLLEDCFTDAIKHVNTTAMKGQGCLVF